MPPDIPPTLLGGRQAASSAPMAFTKAGVAECGEGAGGDSSMNLSMSLVVVNPVVGEVWCVEEEEEEVALGLWW